MRNEMGKWLLGLLLLLGLLAGCQDGRRESSLIDRAELLFASRPDSSLVLLDSVSLPEELDDRSLVRWCMLYGRVADTLYVDLPLPEPFKQAYAYLKSHGTPHEQARMGLYLGRAYMADKEYERAMKIYKESLQTALRHEDYNQAGYICSYTADLYDYEGNYVFAKEKYAEAETYFRKAGNQRSMAFALRDVGRMYVFADSAEVALDYLLKADTIINKVGDSLGIASIANGLGNTYVVLGETERAKAYLWKAIHTSDFESAPNYCVLADIFMSEENYMAAQECLEQAQLKLTLNKETYYSIIYGYYQLEKARGNLNRAMLFLEEYTDACDSIYTERSNANIVEAEKRYDHAKISLENIRLKKEQQLLYIHFILVLVLSFFLLIIYLIRLNMKNRKIYSQKIHLEQKTNAILRLQSELERKQRDLQKISDQLSERDNRILELNSEKKLRNEYERMKEEMTILLKRLSDQRKDLLLSSTVAKRIEKLIRKIEPGKDSSLTEKDWRNIFAEVDSVYPAFDRKLAVFNLTIAELSYCYLALFCLDTKAESILLNILPDSVNKTRHRVRQKLGLVGKETDLYTFLANLV